MTCGRWLGPWATALDEVRALLVRAEEKLRAARLLFDGGDTPDSISGVYVLDGTTGRLKGMKITRFEDLECWQQARILTKAVYTATSHGAFSKDFRLSGQIQGAASSAMANIAEGFVRRSNKEFIQFLFVAMSSAAEVQSHLYVALDQRYVDQKQFDQVYAQADKTARIISGLITYLRTNQTKQTRSPKETRPTKQTRSTR